jgi:hypothetical protein
VQNFYNTCFDVGFQAETRDFSPYAHVETGCGAQPVSCPMGTGGLIHGVKAARRKADHSPRPRDEVNKKWSIPPIPHTSSWRGYLTGLSIKDNFALSLPLKL